MDFKKAALEGLLFIVGDEGLEITQIQEILQTSEEETKQILKDLVVEYSKPERGIKLEILGNKFKLTTKKEHKEYYQKLLNSEREEGLSQSALETLAIIAYNQPITRSEVDQARGVASSHILRRLMLKDLIKVTGKSDLPGRPNLYETTSNFLDYFGLSDISDLPVLNSQKEEQTEEKDLFNSKYTEN